MKKCNAQMLAETVSAEFFIQNALVSMKPVFQFLEMLNALNTGQNVQATAWNALRLIEIVLITAQLNIIRLSIFLDNALHLREG